MMKAFIQRENEIFEILGNFAKSKLRHVLVGGYAVSAYMHRFSVDADLCIDKEDLGSFQDLLSSRHFVLTKRKNLEDVYKGQFESYTKITKLPVTVDLMINSIVSRQTNASVSFAQLYRNSIVKEIVGIEKTINARIPAKEILIALKIHSARLTDARDIAALCHNIDFKLVEKYAQIGNVEEVKNNLRNLISFFSSDNFKDSFKGVFSIEKLPQNNIENAIKLMNYLISISK